MSAYVCIAYEDRIEMLTDGAIYNEDGILLEAAEKVSRSERLPIAVTGRGSSDVVNLFAAYIVALTQFSKSVAEVFSRLETNLESQKSKLGVPPFEIVICAIHEEQGPLTIRFSSVALGDGLEPWTLYALGREVIGGPLIDLDDIRAGGVSIESLCQGLEDQGADLMEILRLRKAGNPAESLLPDVYGIGCHVDHTVIRAAGVTTKRIRTWPDVIGQPIDPHAAPAALASAAA
jgi:hypothetical protein